MPKEVHRQANWNNGALDPKLLGRRDIKSYFNSAAVLENCLMTPQGPLDRRPGLRHISRVRNVLESVSVEGATYTAPNGGDPSLAAAFGLAGLTTTTDMGATAPYVLFTMDLGTPKRVDVFDLVNFSVQPSGGGGDPPIEPPVDYPWSKYGEQEF